MYHLFYFILFYLHHVTQGHKSNFCFSDRSFTSLDIMSVASLKQRELKYLLIEGAKELNITLSDIQINQLFKYKELLLKWNENINLTAITNDTEIITKHFLDCMTVYKAIDIFQVKTLLDVGTGAGFPGMVLKIVFPHLQVTLADSLNKRLKFLQVIIDELGLESIECVHSRAEDLGKDPRYREKFDLCASRAVANMATLSEYSLPFVKIDGYFIALKGQKIDEEIENSSNAIKLLGGKIEDIIDATVPQTNLNHKIAKVKKIKPTPKLYPRKSGEPSKNPLK